MPPVPTAIYGVALLMPALAWQGMQLAILRTHGRDSALAQAIGRDFKGKFSPVLYLAGILSAFIDTRISGAIIAKLSLPASAGPFHKAFGAACVSCSEGDLQ